MTLFENGLNITERILTKVCQLLVLLQVLFAPDVRYERLAQVEWGLVVLSCCASRDCVGCGGASERTAPTRRRGAVAAVCDGSR